MSLWNARMRRGTFLSLMAVLALNAGMYAAPAVASAAIPSATPSATLYQCRNGSDLATRTSGCSTDAAEWSNGSSADTDASYEEGGSVPYRMTFDDIATSGTHTVTLEWDTTTAGKHAIDYLTTWNRTVTDSNPCLGISGCTFPGVLDTDYTQFDIPADPQVTGAGVTPPPGKFTFWGATITGVSAYSGGAGFPAFDNSRSIVISFTAGVANPVLAWGGHIATRQDWGVNGSFVGSPGSYHMRGLTFDGSGVIGDVSLSTAAVAFAAAITITLDATPDDSTSFAFTGSPSPLTAFSLVDDGTSANTKFFGNLPDSGTYTVNETPIPSGWAFDAITCTATIANGGSAASSGTMVTIVLQEGENWTCTYTNHAISSKTLSITATAQETGYSAVGDVIHYDITATNTGNVSQDLSVADSQVSDLSCTPASGSSLAPGASLSCTASHTIIQADIDAGSFNNEACVDATGATRACDDVTTPGTQNPHLAIDKGSTTTVVTAAGQLVPYTYLVTNAGNVTLTGITVTDDEVAMVSCPATTLAPDASMTCSGSHTVTAAEFTAGGNLTNIATADSDQTGPVTDTVTIPITPPANVSQITPTGTCSQFAGGTASTMSDLYYSIKGGTIKQVNPGVFFYWVKVTGAGTYTITQSSSPSLKPFSIASGTVVYDASCNKVPAVIAQNTATGTVTVMFSGTGTFYIGIKYAGSSLKGASATVGQTYVFTFATNEVAGSTKSVNLNP
jgi:hypothetical protein